MKKVFLISLDGVGVFGGHSIAAILSSNSREVIARYIKNQYNLILRDLLPNKYAFQNGNHWEYSTNNVRVDVHVDVVEQYQE